MTEKSNYRRSPGKTKVRGPPHEPRCLLCLVTGLLCLVRVCDGTKFRTIPLPRLWFFVRRIHSLPLYLHPPENSVRCHLKKAVCPPSTCQGDSASSLTHSWAPATTLLGLLTIQPQSSKHLSRHHAQHQSTKRRARRHWPYKGKPGDSQNYGAEIRGSLRR